MARFSGSDADAEEILQETFIRIWLSRDKLPEIDNVDGWIYRIASRECLSFLRRTRHTAHKQTNLDHCGEIAASRNTSPIEKLGAEEIQLAIDRYVESMPQQRRKIFRLSREEGLKPSEIATMLSLSVSTVKNTLSTSLREIRVHLKELGFENLPILICCLIRF